MTGELATVDPDTARRLLHQMVRIRRFEEMCIRDSGGGLGPSLKLVDDRLQFRSDRCAVLDEERSNRLSTGGCDGKDRALVVGIGAPVAAVRPRYRNLGRIELLA